MMNPNDTISFALLLSIGSFIIAFIGVILAVRKQNKDDEEMKKKAMEAENERQLKLTENFTKVNLKLDNFGDTMNQMVIKSDKTSEELRKISDRLIEDKLKIDDHEKRIVDLEDKVK